MSASDLLKQLSDERVSLANTLASRAVAVAISPRRVVAGIRWRGPYVVTAAEALGGAERLRVSMDSDAAEGAGATEAEVVASDLSTDVAIVRAVLPDEPATPPVRDSLTLGESVLVVACGVHGTLLSAGIVGAAGQSWQSRRGGEIAQRLEILAPLDARFEGGVVADTAGRIAAMLVAGPRNRALGIPAVHLERAVHSVELHGDIPRPYLGVRLQMLLLDAASVAQFGRNSPRIPVVAGVEAGSPAAAAGLAPGDLIESVEGGEIDGVGTLMHALTAAGAGRSLSVGVRRGGELQTRSVTLAQRPGH